MTVKNFLGLLVQDTEAGDKDAVDDDIRRIGEAADRMHELLRDVLELSRIGRVVNPPTVFDFGELAQETVELLAGPLMDRGVEVSIAPDLPMVTADRIRMREVLQNLMENSIKFMGDQEHPKIEVGHFAQDVTEGPLQGAVEQVFFVRDNGIGIKPDHQKVIFGLFEQLDPKHEGTGVGLTLVRRIIHVHGGRLWIESDLDGRGTTLYFTLAAPEAEE